MPRRSAPLGRLQPSSRRYCAPYVLERHCPQQCTREDLPVELKNCGRSPLWNYPCRSRPPERRHLRGQAQSSDSRVRNNIPLRRTGIRQEPGLGGVRPLRPGPRACRKAGEGKRLPTLGYGLILLWALFWTLLKDGSLTSIGWVYLKYFFTRNLRYRRDIVGFAQYMNRCVTHWHFYKFTREMTTGKLRVYNTG